MDIKLCLLNKGKNYTGGVQEGGAEKGIWKWEVGDDKELHNEELHDLYSSSNIVCVLEGEW